MSTSPIRFPNEPEGYRSARDALLEAERDLRARVEAVAALRRRLPLGGPVPTNYVFEEGAADLADRETVRRVALADLFEPGKDSLLVYNFMFGPAMRAACPMCSCLLDGLQGAARHVRQRCNFVVVARSPLARIRDHARTRGWTDLRLLSSADNDFNRDYLGEDADGSQNALMHVFVKRAGVVHHAYCTELQFLPPEPGQNQRHVDAFWPLWNLLDLLPEGRGSDWYPSLAY